MAIQYQIHQYQADQTEVDLDNSSKIHTNRERVTMHSRETRSQLLRINGQIKVDNLQWTSKSRRHPEIMATSRTCIDQVQTAMCQDNKPKA